MDSHGSSTTNVYTTLHLSLPAGHCSRPGPKYLIDATRNPLGPRQNSNSPVKTGVGREVVRYLTRSKPLRKAAFSDPSERPTPEEQYETLAVQRRVSEPQPSQITLVDDIVTRGATLMGAANRLAEVFPEARISGFAAMRTVSPSDFAAVYDPQSGTIRFRESTKDTLRRP